MAVKKSTAKAAKKGVKKSKQTAKKVSRKAVKKTVKTKPVSKNKKVAKKKPAKAPAKKIAKKVAVKKAVVKKPAIVKPERVKEAKIVIPNTPPSYVYPDANAFKGKVRTILVSQPKPENDKSPYVELARRWNVKIDFRHFIKVEGMSTKEFRQQRINLTEHNGVILTSRNAIDHFFRICAEMRYNVPETTKYFCLNEATAYYLQKYIQYRKRKIFYGNGTISDLAEALRKNKEEHFLLPVADVHREEKIIDILDILKLNYKKAIIYRTVSADLSDFNGKLDYDVVVFFTPAGIRSLFKNFPGFKQGELRIAAFGAATARAVKEHGLRLDIGSPNPETPSMTMALEKYVREVNKR
jgi:uroporphyrinogen-III synthase